MPVATVTVAGKAAPELGKKRGRIKGIDGMLFQADPSLLDAISVGATYQITYKDDEFNGNKFRVVEGAMPATPGMAMQPAAQAPQAGRPMSSQQSMPTTKDEDIATLAIAKEQLNKINPGDVEMGFHVLKSSAMMWRKFKSWQKLGPQTVKEDMEDDIPY